MNLAAPSAVLARRDDGGSLFLGMSAIWGKISDISSLRMEIVGPTVAREKIHGDVWWRWRRRLSLLVSEGFANRLRFRGVGNDVIWGRFWFTDRERSERNVI